MAQSRSGSAKDSSGEYVRYPIMLSEVETLAYISQYHGHLHPRQEENIKYYILNDDRIIIYSDLIKKGHMYPASDPFVKSYNPSFVELNPLMKDIKPEHFLSMDKYVDSYLSQLEDILDFKIEIANNDSLYLQKLSNKITAYTKEQGYKKIFIPLFVYLGEKIRQHSHGVWTLELVVRSNLSNHEVILVDATGKKIKYYSGELQDWLESEYGFSVSFVISRSIKGR